MPHSSNAFSRPSPPSPAASPPDVSALYIVRLRSAPPVASYRGGLPGYPATAVWDSDPNGNATDATADDTAAAGAATTNALGGRLGRPLRRPRVNVRAPGVRAFKQLLQRMQQAVLRDSGVDAGKMLYSYTHVSNGFSAKLTPAQVQRMRRHPSVASVTQARVLRPATTDSYKFLGLPSSLWADAGGPSSAGDGTVIGIVDTGIWPENGSFDDRGYSSTLPAGWVGDCFSTRDMSCNKKIIGGDWFYEGFVSSGNTIDLSSDWLSPRDAVGHGTMCAGIAAGNSNVEVPDIESGRASGMAPGARLAIYKVFWQAKDESFYATTTDIFAAIDQAVADGVDVLSLSLAEAHSTDTYFDDLPFISVNAAGVFVAFAAGNEARPSVLAVTNYRTLCNFSPYYMTVGASTILRNGASLSSTTAAATAPASFEAPSNTTFNTANTVATLSGRSFAPVVSFISSTGPLSNPMLPSPAAAHPSNTILKPNIIAPGEDIYATPKCHTG
ncbi:unnamed protein product [Closterium sp. Naga37s-1]|nr:unnamed protein product [Closterium sp. Naga37s-1]